MTEVKRAMERIRKFFGSHPQVPLGRFARDAKLHRNSLYGLHSDSWNPTAETLEKCLIHIEKMERSGVAKKGRKSPSEAAA